MEYDVVIVGARVAGASLALQLGERGRRVLMIDRDRFPSDTLSTHLTITVGQFTRLGVLADIEAAGFRRLTRFRSYFEDCLLESPIAPGGGYGLAPRRDALDAILIDHAMRRGGAEVWQATTVESLLREHDRVVGVQARTADGALHEIRACVVVGADGKYSKVAQWVGAQKYHATPAIRPAYYGYYHGLEPLPEPAVEMFFDHGQIAFIFPMQPGVDCLAIGALPEDFAAFRADPQGVFETRFRGLHGMARRMEHATLEGKVLGTQGIANHFHQPYGPGWALVGDAGYLRDPSTGTGIHDALLQSFLLADALDATFTGADWDATLTEFQRRRDDALLPMYNATLDFARMPATAPEALAALRATLSSPVLVRHLPAGLPVVAAQLFPAELQPAFAAGASRFAKAAQSQPAPVAPQGESRHA